MFSMSYKSNYPNRVSIVSEIDTDDVTLKELFAYFVEMTRQIGYHMGSYKHIIEEIDQCDEDYPLDMWASDVMVSHSIREKDDF